MASRFGDLIYYAFTPPGRVSVSENALAKAREFWHESNRAEPDKDWLVSFDWGDVRRYRDQRSGIDWQDLGPGLDIVVYERKKVPPQFIQVEDGTEILIKIDRLVWERSERRLIDIEQGRPILR